MSDLTPLRLAVGRTRRHVDQLRRSVHEQRAELDDMRRQLELFEGQPPPDDPGPEPEVDPDARPRRFRLF